MKQPCHPPFPMGPRLLVAGLLGLGTLTARTDDWPQWRGPNRDGISKETGLLKEWPKDGPKLLWQINDIGSGYSTPSVVKDQLFLLGNESTSAEFVQARAVADGKRLWSVEIGKVGPNQGPQYPGTRSTPTIDGDRLYAMGSDGDLVCLDASTGQIRWRKNLRSDFGGKPGNWAYAESPLVDGKAVICTPGGSEATVVALDKTDGSLIWKSAVPGGDQAAYTSVIKAEIGGVPQYIQMLQKGVVGLDARTGQFLWRYDKTAERSPANIPTPIANGEKIYSASGRGGGGLIRIKSSQSGFEPEQIYANLKLPNAIGGFVRVGDYLYGTTTGGVLACVEYATGTARWDDRSIAPGAICYADDRLYLHGENGMVALIEASPEAYREKGRFTPPDLPERGSGKAWTYPVVANGRLYIRDLERLWSYDVSGAR